MVRLYPPGYVRRVSTWSDKGYISTEHVHVSVSMVTSTIFTIEYGLSIWGAIFICFHGNQVSGQMSAMSVNETKGHGTIHPSANFDPEADAGILRKAMKGLGTDEDAIINLLVARSNDQRIAIAKRFKLMYGKVTSY